MVSFQRQIVDQIRRQSSCASCKLCSHCRRDATQLDSCVASVMCIGHMTKSAGECCECQVLTSVIMVCCFSYVRVSVSSVLRREGGRSQLLVCGLVTQLGSFSGALVSFILVAVVKVFQSSSPCAN